MIGRELESQARDLGITVDELLEADAATREAISGSRAASQSGDETFDEWQARLKRQIAAEKRAWAEDAKRKADWAAAIAARERRNAKALASYHKDKKARKSRELAWASMEAAFRHSRRMKEQRKRAIKLVKARLAFNPSIVAEGFQQVWTPEKQYREFNRL